MAEKDKEKLRQQVRDAISKTLSEMRNVSQGHLNDQAAKDLTEQQRRAAELGDPKDEEREAELDVKDIQELVKQELRQHQDAGQRSYQAEPGEGRNPSQQSPEFQKRMVESALSYPTSNESLKEMQQAADDLWMARQILTQWKGQAPDVSLQPLENRFWDRARAAGFDVRSISTLTDAKGGNWTFDEPTPELVERVNVVGDIERTFAARTIGPRRKSVTILLRGARPKFYKVAQQTNAPGTNDVTVSAPGTDNLELTVGKLMSRVYMTEEFLEDAIIEGFGYVRGEIAEEYRLTKERCIINGDTGATMDDDASSGDDTTIFHGLRKMALTEITADADIDLGSDQAPKGLNLLFKAAGRYAANPADGYLIAPITWVHNNISDDDFRTLDKMGTQATLLQGAIGQVYGRSVMVSEFSREDLDDSGVHSGTPADDDKHSVMYVYRRGWEFIRKREFRIEMEKKIELDQHVLVGSTRIGFSRRYPLSEPIVVLGYNLDNDPS